jgi:Lon protease-like protein
MIIGSNGLTVKVRGRERFRIIKTSRDTAGCLTADVKLLPDIILDKNPLLNENCPPHMTCYIKSYLKMKSNKFLNDSKPK